MSGPPEAMAAAPPMRHPGASVAELSLAEFMMNVRSAGFRVLGLVLAVVTALSFVASRYADPLLLGLGPLAEENVRSLMEGLLLILAPLLVCGAARREQRLGMEELYLSKPPTSEALFWGKFLGVYAALLVLIPTTVATAVIAQLCLFRGQAAVLPAIVGGLRVALPALFIAGLSFAVATFARSAMVAGLVVALLIGLMAGRAFMVPALRFTLTPYHLAYGLLGLALAAAMAGGWERRRQPERLVPPSWVAAAACLAAAVGVGALAARTWRGWTMEEDPALLRLADWKPVKDGRLPATPLRTLSGPTVRLSDWQGRPAVLVFWSPGGAGGAVEAAVLERAWWATARERVGFASVCMTDDPPRARDIARAAGLSGPVIWNPPSQFGQDVGLAAMFNLSDPPRTAVAALIRRDGTFNRGTAPVSGPPQNPRGRPPHHDWERRLHELATRAFRQLAEGGG